MLAIIINSELFQLFESPSKSLPTYSFLLSIMHLFVMLPLMLFSKDKKSEQAARKFIRYNKELEFTIRKEGRESIIILKQEYEDKDKTKKS